LSIAFEVTSCSRRGACGSLLKARGGCARSAREASTRG
jgi:hypothetical protein